MATKHLFKEIAIIQDSHQLLRDIHSAFACESRSPEQWQQLINRIEKQLPKQQQYLIDKQILSPGG